MSEKRNKAIIFLADFAAGAVFAALVILIFLGVYAIGDLVF